MTQKGKIVLAGFPFDDLTRSKVRPCLCLSERVGEFDHMVLAFITSRINLPLPETDFLIDSDSEEFAQTGLQVSSVLRLHRLVTLDMKVIKRQLGTMTLKMMPHVNARLRLLLDLREPSSEHTMKN